MHQTTLRFGPELWADLDMAARQAGISIAQYVREAAVARLAHADALDQANADPGLPGEGQASGRRLQRARDASEDERQSSDALWAQSKLARKRARGLRAEAARLRRT